MKNELIERLRKELPPIFARTAVDKLTGNVVRGRTLANLSSLGKGPGGTYRDGKKVILEREAFLSWLADRLEPCKKEAGEDRDAA
jgi:hypothetical protein